MQIVPLGVRLLAMTCADHQGAARNEGRPWLAAWGRKAPIDPNCWPGLGTLPCTNSVHRASSDNIKYQSRFVLIFQ